MSNPSAIPSGSGGLSYADFCARKSMSTLMEELTTTGKMYLDKSKLKRLFLDARVSVEHLEYCVELIFRQLKVNHAQVRLSALLVLNELVTRSDHFRKKIFFVNKELLMNFLDLTLRAVPVTKEKNKKARNKRKLLPASITKILKLKTLELFQLWCLDYGEENKRRNFIRSFVIYIIDKLGMSFPDPNSKDTSEFNSSLNSGSVTPKLPLKSVRLEVDKKEEEIRQTVFKIKSCFNLIIPNYYDSVDDGKTSIESSSKTDDYTPTTLSSSSSSIPVRISLTGPIKITRCEGNEATLNKLEDLYKLINKRFLPMVNKWLSSTDLKRDSILKNRVINLKFELLGEKSKYERLQIQETDSDDDYESTDDSEFEEVGEDIPEWTHFSSVTASMSETATDKLPSTSTAEMESSGGEAEGQERTTDFKQTSQTFRSCRARLGNGKLCERKDAFNCPFHGKIIPRDEKGNPQNPSDIEVEAKRLDAEKKKNLDWQDPGFLKTLELKTGKDLSIRKPTKGSKSFAARYPALMPLRRENHGRKRIARKFAKYKSVKRRKTTLGDTIILEDTL